MVSAVPEGAYDKSRNHKLLSLSLRKIMMFTSIGITCLSSWLAAAYVGFSDDVWHSAEDSPIISMVDPLAPVAFRLGVVVAGLVLERIHGPEQVNLQTTRMW